MKNSMILWVQAFLFISLQLLFLSVSASDLNFKDSEQCSIAINYYEQKYKIPKKLLQSIAIIESGRWDQNTKQHKPWPWAVNVEGNPYYFETKYQAIEFVRSQLHKGKRNIDVGCNQINLHHHGKNFSNLEQAFNPVSNTNYAAKFLKGHFEETKSWVKAVARYHSHTQSLGDLYAGKVFSKWRGFVKEMMPTKNIEYIPHPPMKKRTSTANIRKKTSKINTRRANDGMIVFSRERIKMDIARRESESVVQISERLLQTQ